MNVLNLALRCAKLYTNVDVTKMSGVDAMLFADALTAGLQDYWNQAPDWVKAPEEPTNLATVANTATVTLPTHFEQLIRPPRIRRASTDSWIVLQETVEPVLPATTGVPLFFRVRNNLVDSPAWDEASTPGNTLDTPLLVLYPTPNAVYSLNVQCRYHAPRIRVEHLAGLANTVNLPIPDHHLTTMVVPLCAPHFVGFPGAKPSLTVQSAAAAASRGFAALQMVPSRRTTRPPRIGTPNGF